MMLEYVLFGQLPFEKFLAFVKARGVKVETFVDDEIYQVNLPENINADVCLEIQGFYKQMMDLNQSIFESESRRSANYEAAGIVVPLKNGSTAYANVDGGILAKIMSALDADELGMLVGAIAGAVEQPDNRPLNWRQSA